MLNICYITTRQSQIESSCTYKEEFCVENLHFCEIMNVNAGVLIFAFGVCMVIAQGPEMGPPGLGRGPPPGRPFGHRGHPPGHRHGHRGHKHDRHPGEGMFPACEEFDRRVHEMMHG